MSIGDRAGSDLVTDPAHPNGGNFNEGIRIDTSHASVAPPAPPAKRVAYLPKHPPDGFGGGAGGGFEPGGGMGGAPPRLPQVTVGVNPRRTDTAERTLFRELNKEAEKWLGGVPWGALQDEQIEQLVKTTVEAMGIQRGLRITWD